MNSEVIFFLVILGGGLVFMLELLIAASLCLRFRDHRKFLSDDNKYGNALVWGWLLSGFPSTFFTVSIAEGGAFNLFHYAIGIAVFLYGIFLFFKSAAALNKQIENFGREASTEVDDSQ